MEQSPSDDLIAFAITEAFGRRCSTCDDNCYTCRAWAEYDRLSAQQREPDRKQLSETGKELLKNTEQPMNNADVSVGELAGFFVTEFPHLLTMLTQIEVARTLLSRYSVRRRG